ncbi:MAG: ACT domain-containing protein [Eubacteriales bacterium]
MIIKQLSIFLENKTGRLTEVTQTLGNNGINISALSVADTSEYGILRLIVSNPEKAVEVLKESGFSVSLTDVICIKVPHTNGALNKALQIFSKENISIEYMYAFAVDNNASVIMKVKDIHKSIDILKEHQLELINADEAYQI